MGKLTDVRLHNHSVFSSRFTPRRDKILMAMQEPDKLKLRPEDEEYKNLLIQAFSILSKPNIRRLRP